MQNGQRRWWAAARSERPALDGQPVGRDRDRRWLAIERDKPAIEPLCDGRGRP